MAENLIEPKTNSVDIQPAQPEPATPESSGGEIPEKFLRLPAAGPLLAGSPPAMSLKIKDMAATEDGKIIAESGPALQAANIFFYRALSGDIGIIGNGAYIAPEAIKQADERGQLASIAPDWNMVGQEAARNPDINPVMSAGAPPAAAAMAPAPEPPQSASGRLPAPPASSQTSLSKARTKNLQPGSPTSGPAPGRGRLLNNLLKPAI